MSVKKPKIILVEDEPELADMFGTALKTAGFEVEVVGDGLMALKKIRNEKPDLVLLDLVIPEMDGYAVLEKTKQYKSTKNVCIYIWSNLTQQNEIDRAKKLGADGYMIKSNYTPAKFIEKVKSILNQK
ncbi:MAG TPA: response regulator [Patescibacteria group bacterium]|nr:response regulator [Patescibacteria group bacterium]